jgi:peptidoglycan/LPS O-acetylase OafA/YrhL
VSPLSPLPYFVWMTAYVLLAALIAKRWPFFAREGAVVAKTYNVPLEGLRGVLALSVFLYHAALTYVYFRTGELGDVTRFYEHCGSSAVLVFFFLTGFLFWSKVLRTGAPNVFAFLRARAWRIFPAYYLSVALVVLISAARSHFQLVESAPRVVQEVVRWCGFGFLGFPNINAVPKTILANSGVFWTLEWEWVFYFILPWLGWFAHGRRVFWIAALLSCEYGISRATGRQGGMAHIFLTGFYPGMLSAHVVRSRFASWLVQQRWSGIIPVVTMTAAVLLPPRSPLVVVLLATAFTAIASGVDVYGLLRTSGLVLLGRISYSTYILHGAVLFVGSRVLDRIAHIGGMSPPAYWASIGVVGLAVVVVSAVSFQFVEHPFLAGVRAPRVRVPERSVSQEA